MSVGAGIVWTIDPRAPRDWRVEDLVNEKRKLIGKAVADLDGRHRTDRRSLRCQGQYDRPEVTSELAGVKLGMTPPAVTLALGKPTSEEGPPKSDGGEPIEDAALRYAYARPMTRHTPWKSFSTTTRTGYRPTSFANSGGQQRLRLRKERVSPSSSRNWVDLAVRQYSSIGKRGSSRIRSGGRLHCLERK